MLAIVWEAVWEAVCEVVRDVMELIEAYRVDQAEVSRAGLSAGQSRGAPWSHLRQASVRPSVPRRPASVVTQAREVHGGS